MFLTVLLAALAIYALQNSDKKEDAQSSAGTPVDTVDSDGDTLRTKKNGRSRFRQEKILSKKKRVIPTS